MKKIIIIIILLPTLLLGQNIEQLKGKKLNDLNDTELMMYWKQAQDNGYTLNQIKILARAQGVTEKEINEFEKRINLLTKESEESGNNIKMNSDYITSIFGIDANSTDEDEDEEELTNEDSKLPIFGSNFFDNDKISSVPTFNIATPKSYELGPGDEIIISIWGAAENDYSETISREGYIKIERLGPVFLSGLTISEAKEKLKRNLSKIYSGLSIKSSSEFKVYIDLSLVNTRSIVVNVTGNVNAPNTYTISALSSILNVLYASGGPNDSGTFRNIKVIRDGKTIKTIDLYEYFSKGELQPFSLRDQDIILVPNYSNRVFVNGEFKINGIFEFKKNETLTDLLKYTGGISSFGIKEKIYVKRTDGLFRKIDNISYENFHNYELNDGDIVEARTVTDIYTNLVSIEGAIAVPGEYSIENINNIEELITEAGGLNDFAIKDRAYLIRKINGVENQIISFNIENSKNIKLASEDKIIISSNIDLNRSKNVSIQGEVFEPDLYPFFEGMTLIDLILISKGITLKGDLNNIELYRSTYDESKKNPVKTFKLSLNSDFSKIDEKNNLLLQENDLVIIREKLGFQEKEFVNVEGLAKYPGTYAIRNNNYTFKDLILDFGGFLPDASLEGIKISRTNSIYEDIKEKIETLEIESNEFEIIDENEIDDFQIDKSQSIIDSLKISLINTPKSIEFGIDVKNILKSNKSDSKYNVVLKPNDIITIPRKDNTVEISGKVQQPSVVTFSKTLSTRNAIGNAGGFSQEAKRNGVYVVYQNGNVASSKSFLFFTRYPKLKPGSKIIVPSKGEEKNNFGIGEIVGYTTSLVSILALFKSL